jgi:ribosomal protein S27E
MGEEGTYLDFIYASWAFNFRTFVCSLADQHTMLRLLLKMTACQSEHLLWTANMTEMDCSCGGQAIATETGGAAAWQAPLPCRMAMLRHAHDKNHCDCKSMTASIAASMTCTEDQFQ